VSRTARLFDILQSLRRRRTPVAAAVLAQELGVSLRTLYRDVAALTASGAPIRGEPGVGYILEAGHFLPPLSFSEDELDAVLLGLNWVEKRADGALARAAEDALAKIAAVLPKQTREAAEAPAVFVGPDTPGPIAAVSVGQFRSAVRGGLKVRMQYIDAEGLGSERIIWPIGLAFMEEVRLVVAWCELRGAFRHFRLDRILSAQTQDSVPERRVVLLRRWREQQRTETANADTGCQYVGL
jgi:predicted DNA-binding transcriptional regulator YafY